MTRKPILQLTRWATFALIVLFILFVIALAVMVSFEGVRDDFSNFESYFEVAGMLYLRVVSAVWVYIIVGLFVLVYIFGILLYYLFRRVIVKTQSNILILLAIALEAFLAFNWKSVSVGFYETGLFNPVIAVIALLDVMALVLPKKR